MAEPLEELYMPQIEQFGIELRRVGDALVGEVSSEQAVGAVCVYRIDGAGVVTSHRLHVRRDMPFYEHGLPGLVIGELSADSLALCPVDRPRRGGAGGGPGAGAGPGAAAHGEKDAAVAANVTGAVDAAGAARGFGADGSAGVAVFGQDRSERSYLLRAGSLQDAVSMTLLPEWMERWHGELGQAGRALMDGAGETCPDEVAAALGSLMRATTPLFGGKLADGRAVVERMERATQLALAWHRERERAEAASGTLGQARLVRAARRHVRQHLAEPLTIDGIAHDLLTSRSRLCEAFRAETGESLGVYIRRSRMERAARMLEVDAASVGAVAKAVGYPRASSFVVAFEREFGCSPGAWRTRG